MKKNYTAFLLLLTVMVFSQNKKVKETSEKGYYFKQVGEKVEVWNGILSERGGTGTYAFKKGEKAETLTVEKRGGGEKRPSIASFSSPNDVVVTQDAAGNKYWWIIDGTIVKTELVDGISSSTKPKIESTVAPIQAEVVAPAISVQEEKPAVVITTPESTIAPIQAEVVAPAISVQEEKPAVVITTPESTIAPIQAEVVAPAISVQEEKPAVVITTPESAVAPIQAEVVAPAISVQEEKPAVVIATLESAVAPEVKKTEEVIVTPLKEVVAPAIPVQEEKPAAVTTPEIPVVQKESKNISIEETEIPEEAIIKFDEQIKDTTIPTDTASTKNILTESSEKIEVAKGEVGDVTELFEKNYEDMSRKEKKIYKKNEKKIMKQLEKELKNSQEKE